MSRIAVVAIIKAKSEFADYVQEQFLSLVEPTVKNDEGCINYDLHQDNDDPTLFYVLENWESRELLDRHSASDHVQACLKNTEEKIEELQVNVVVSIRLEGREGDEIEINWSSIVLIANTTVAPDLTRPENFLSATACVRTECIMKKLRDLSDSDIAAHSQRFFKTGKGEYGEGDRFLGIRVPTIRKCLREYSSISLENTIELLKSPFHEARLLALLILVAKYSSTKESAEKDFVYRTYLSHTKFINNWDLVDSSAPQIVGAHLFSRDRNPIYRLAGSKNLWERRISILSTFYFIRREDFSDTLAIAELLLRDREDLIHKATGWMLREVGNRNREVEEKFLDRHYKEMPRTMLRYAIEKLPKKERLAYLHGTK